MLPVRRYWCDGVTEGECVSSAKFAVFQVERPGMRQQQVAPFLWVHQVLHDSVSYRFITMVKARDRRDKGRKGGLGRGGTRDAKCRWIRPVKVWQGREGRRIPRCWRPPFSMTAWGNEADSSFALNRDISVIPNAPAATESHGAQNSREATLTSTSRLPPG